MKDTVVITCKSMRQGKTFKKSTKRLVYYKDKHTRLVQSMGRAITPITPEGK